MTRSILIAFIRNDLRLTDHPILSQCSASGDALSSVTHVLPVYIFDQQYIEVGGFDGLEKGQGAGNPQARTRLAEFWRTGMPRIRFITRSVFDLQRRLRGVGSDLSIWSGQPHVILPRLVEALQGNGDHVHGVWMGKEPHTEEMTTERRIRKALSHTQVNVKTFDHRTLILTQDLPFPIKKLPDVYTQFRKRVEAPDMYRAPLPAPEKLKPFPSLPDVKQAAGVYAVQQDEQQTLNQLLAPLEKDPGELAPPKDDVESNKLSAFPMKGGETEALERLEHYCRGGKQSPAAQYKETRNGMLGADYSTKFSAALGLGLLSPRTIAQRVERVDRENGVHGRDGGGYWIVFELLWRDYFLFVSQKYGSKMFTQEGIAEALEGGTQAEPQKWNMPRSLGDSKDGFVRWATAQTGVPLIDANMKELALTGFMSNRGRQNVASLLTKDLYYDWRLGAEWFESLLVDYDVSSNWGNWQYVAGVGNDPRASRMFNPIKQGKDYDREANYLKAWLPPLRALPANDAHHPWTSTNPPDGYPARPVCENPTWKKHYSGHSTGPGGIRGGSGGGGGGRGGRGGRGGGRGGGQNRRGGGDFRKRAGAEAS